ncbi:hypothetical protein J6590_070729 [Homalodisca vitripennis]|nr:hypothetical protein J6590_070729 [Homalodisca vitripennis]
MDVGLAHSNIDTVTVLNVSCILTGNQQELTWQTSYWYAQDFLMGFDRPNGDKRPVEIQYNPLFFVYYYSFIRRGARSRQLRPLVRLTDCCLLWSISLNNESKQVQGSAQKNQFCLLINIIRSPRHSSSTIIVSLSPIKTIPDGVESSDSRHRWRMKFTNVLLVIVCCNGKLSTSFGILHRVCYKTGTTAMDACGLGARPVLQLVSTQNEPEDTKEN